MIVRSYQDVEAETYDERPGVTVRWVIGAAEGAPTFAMRVFELQPNASSALHAHAWEHEVFVLAGEGIVWSEAGESNLRCGDTAFVAPNEKHQFTNVGEDVLRFICVIPILEGS
jgi:quercetin dioxygenase-like cupin family protein